MYTVIQQQLYPFIHWTAFPSFWNLKDPGVLNTKKYSQVQDTQF